MIGQAGDGFALLEVVKDCAPDLILMGIALPKLAGTDAIRLIKKRFPRVKIVVLTLHSSEEYLVDAFRAGADGYVLKRATRGELETALKSVLSGNQFVSPGIVKGLITAYLDTQGSSDQESWQKSLTHREKATLKLIAEGYTNKDIALMFGVSVRTVEKHRANLMNKLNIHNTASLTAFAIEKGLVTS